MLETQHFPHHSLHADRGPTDILGAQPACRYLRWALGELNYVQYEPDQAVPGEYTYVRRLPYNVLLRSS